ADGIELRSNGFDCLYPVPFEDRPEELLDLFETLPGSGITRFERPFEIISDLKEFDRKTLDRKPGLCVHLPRRSLPEIFEIGSKPQEPVIQFIIVTLQIRKGGSG